MVLPTVFIWWCPTPANGELFKHFVPLVGVPSSAVMALAIVGIALTTASPERQASMASAVILWILCFLAIVFVIATTWRLSGA